MTSAGWAKRFKDIQNSQGLALFSPRRLQFTRSLGFFILTSLTGKGMTLCAQNAGTSFRINVGSLNAPLSYHADLYNGGGNIPASGSLVWLQYQDDGTNINMAESGDGFLFQQVYTVTKASSWLGSSGFVYFGLGLNQQGPTTLAYSLMSYHVSNP